MWVGHSEEGDEAMDGGDFGQMRGIRDSVSRASLSSFLCIFFIYVP